MALIDIINDYTEGSTGSFGTAGGQSASWTVTEGNGTWTFQNYAAQLGGSWFAGFSHGDNAYVTKGMEVLVNGDSYLFDNTYLQPWPNNTFPNLLVDAKQYNQGIVKDSRKWFALVLNVSNEYQTMNLNLWEMQFDASKPAYVQQTTQLKLVFGETKEFDRQEIKPGAYYELKGWPGLTTNVRLLTELINEENQPLMLNRYTVRDNQYAEMIDNALPPLKMTREPVR